MSNNISVFTYLPPELIRHILSFAPITSPSSVCIKRLINIYEIDHNWYLTKKARMYYVKNIISFSQYYWYSREEPDDFELGPFEYDKLIGE
jgi:hypothetical protein